MKIIASGDHHWDEHSRFEECVRVHRFISDEVARQQADVFVSAGDIYERLSTIRERHAVADWLGAVADTCPVLVVRGNHDRFQDTAFLSRLRTKHPVIVEEGAGVHVIAGVAFGCVAWPNRAMLAAALGKPMGSEALDTVAGAALRDVFGSIGTQLDSHQGPRVLVTHAMITGAVTSLGQPLIGGEFPVGLGDLALARADIAIAAHIHKPQDWQHGAMPIVYTGSPFRTAFGELEEKSIVMAEFRPERGSTGALLFQRWDRIPTPATPMLLLHDVWGEGAHGIGEWTCGLTGLGAEQEIPGAEIRFRYEVEADQRDAARGAAARLRDELLASGATSVKLEEVVRATTRARVPEIASATTTFERLLLLLDSRRIVITNDRRARLQSMLRALEEKAA